MNGAGKLLILLGDILVVVGVLLTLFERIPYLGKLPGDIHVKRDNLNSISLWPRVSFSASC